MKVSIRNNQEKLKVTKAMRDTVKAAVKSSLDFMKFGDRFEISVMFVDDEEIRVLNKLHRNIDRSTDVLSFPMYEYDEEGNIIEEYSDFNKNGDLILGDIVISLEHALAQSEEYGHSFERELGFLTVHVFPQHRKFTSVWMQLKMQWYPQRVILSFVAPNPVV